MALAIGNAQTSVRSSMFATNFWQMFHNPENSQSIVALPKSYVYQLPFAINQGLFVHPKFPPKRGECKFVHETLSDYTITPPKENVLFKSVDEGKEEDIVGATCSLFPCFGTSFGKFLIFQQRPPLLAIHIRNRGT
jgi:hypothetical protein